MGYSNILALPIFENTIGAMIAGIVTAILVSATVTFFLGINQKNEVTKASHKNYSDNSLVAICDGTLEPLSQVNDKAFSSGALGNGVAFKLSGNYICSPANGTLSALFPTGHAFGITTKDGEELLVHIGINTVDLKGKGFNVLAQQGDEIKAGQPIIRVDRNYIEGQGYDLTTMLVFTNTKDKKTNLKDTGNVSVGTIINL